MVFGIFARKSTLDDAQSSASPDNESRTTEHNRHGRLLTPTPTPTPAPSTTSAAPHSPLRFPIALRSILGGSTTDLAIKDSVLGKDEGRNDMGSPGPPPSQSPSPPPPTGSAESKALYELMLTIPPKTLHAYALARLRPRTPLPSSSASSPGSVPHPERTTPPPSPNTIAKTATFFSTLVPPPLLHCARCHGDFFAIDNEEKDNACRVPHDDESALVERVPGVGYETLWGCCGQTVDGDGSEGPPDGWCYEGRHTTDTKRARFRSDSTIYRDKLTSCLRLNCHGSVVTDSQIKSFPARSQASVVIVSQTRKRTWESLKEACGSEDEQAVESTRGRATQLKSKGKQKFIRTGDEDEDTNMAVDEPLAPSKSKAKPKPIFKPRPPPSVVTTRHSPPPYLTSILPNQSRLQRNSKQVLAHYSRKATHNFHPILTLRLVHVLGLEV
ncbi:hypothetical protein BU15DRAFT_77892 [Melanogaster broomeanus]|nr:hypothetical protein BU15DRAFT_77892 [Melanogaster broomeanus]